MRGGLLGAVRLLLAIEEHGQGRQYLRIRLWPVIPPGLLVSACLFTLLAMVAALSFQWTAWALLNVPAVFLVGRALYESAAAMAAARQAVSLECPPLPAPAPTPTPVAPVAALPAQ